MTAARLRTTAALAVLAGCAPAPPPTAPPPVTPAGLPPIPRVAGAVDLRVVHPTPAVPRPAVDSTFVYGSTGTGDASLTINGRPVPVEPNGAFLAYLPVPEDGRYRLLATAHGETRELVVGYRSPPAPTPAAAPVATVEFSPPRAATASAGDTLATGSEVAIGRPTPTGTFRWFLPRGARLVVTAQRGDQFRTRLGESDVWFAADRIALDAAAAPAPAAFGGTRIVDADGWTDLHLDISGAAFLIDARPTELGILIYGRTTAAHEVAHAPGSAGMIAAESWTPGATDTRIRLELTERLWGYKAWYEPDGTLVVRLRRPPRIDSAQPLRGVRVLVDPGHPPAGATGPTGLTEAEANLAIALRLAELLRAGGAEVTMTRATAAPLVSATDASAELSARTELAVRSDAHLLVSVHNNAFAEGANPFRSHGTSTYFFHPFAEGFARALNEEILAATLIPDLGVRHGNFAVVRPTWMPAALTESVFMPIPQQEAALRDADFVDRLSSAHLRGIERFLRGL